MLLPIEKRVGKQEPLIPVDSYAIQQKKDFQFTEPSPVGAVYGGARFITAGKTGSFFTRAESQETGYVSSCEPTPLAKNFESIKPRGSGILRVSDEEWEALWQSLRWNQEKLNHCHQKFQTYAKRHGENEIAAIVATSFMEFLRCHRHSFPGGTDMILLFSGRNSMNCKQFLRFLALCDSETSHQLSDATGHLRLRMIHTSYDYDSKGYLSEGQYSTFVADVARLADVSFRNPGTILEALAFRKGSVSQLMSFDAFVDCVNRGVIRGTSQLLRLNIGIPQSQHPSTPAEFSRSSTYPYLQLTPTPSCKTVEPPRPQYPAFEMPSTSCNNNARVVGRCVYSSQGVQWYDAQGNPMSSSSASALYNNPYRPYESATPCMAGSQYAGRMASFPGFQSCGPYAKTADYVRYVGSPEEVHFSKQCQNSPMRVEEVESPKLTHVVRPANMATKIPAIQDLIQSPNPAFLPRSFGGPVATGGELPPTATESMPTQDAEHFCPDDNFFCHPVVSEERKGNYAPPDFPHISNDVALQLPRLGKLNGLSEEHLVMRHLRETDVFFGSCAEEEAFCQLPAVPSPENSSVSSDDSPRIVSGAAVKDDVDNESCQGTVRHRICDVRPTSPIFSKFATTNDVRPMACFSDVTAKDELFNLHRITTHSSSVCESMYLTAEDMENLRDCRHHLGPRWQKDRYRIMLLMYLQKMVFRDQSRMENEPMTNVPLWELYEELCSTEVCEQDREIVSDVRAKLGESLHLSIIDDEDLLLLWRHFSWIRQQPFSNEESLSPSVVTTRLANSFRDATFYVEESSGYNVGDCCSGLMSPTLVKTVGCMPMKSVQPRPNPCTLKDPGEANPSLSCADCSPRSLPRRRRHDYN